jgi:cysteine sulfinate desulfinase/cysteine desulfurase-like protein
VIYLDHNAKTRVLSEVFEAMRPYFCEEGGNLSSSCRFGSKLKAVVETARGQVAELICGIEAEAMLILVDQEGICASSGSACLAGSDEPSHVVKAIKPESAAARQMIRFSLDRANTGGCSLTPYL